ncbi:unnamed protein product [Rhizophagus irregularis]|nr:unnamed protein product [Rhizophagus irregularis]
MFFFKKKNTFFSLGQTWTWTSERLGRLEFQKGMPAWNLISAWAIKVSWVGRRPPRFGFHKGDALPDLDFIKVMPFLDLDFGLGY